MDGLGLERDVIKAEQYLRLGASRGDSNAMMSLAKLLINKYEFKEAEQIYERAFSSGSLLALAGRASVQKELSYAKEKFDFVMGEMERQENCKGDLSKKERMNQAFQKAFHTNISMETFQNVSAKPHVATLTKKNLSIEDKMPIVDGKARNGSVYGKRM